MTWRWRNASVWAYRASRWPRWCTSAWLQPAPDISTFFSPDKWQDNNIGCFGFFFWIIVLSLIQEAKKSNVDFCVSTGRGQKNIASSQAVLALHICRATFACRTFPCQGQIFPHQTFAYHKINRHLPIQTFAYQFRFTCYRHVPIRNSTQGTFAYQTIALSEGKWKL